MNTDEQDYRMPYEFINRPYKSIIEDILARKIPQRYDKMTYILWCITVEEEKHPYGKKPRKRLLKVLYDYLNNTLSEEETRKSIGL